MKRGGGYEGGKRGLVARQNTVFKEAYNRYAVALRTDTALPSEPEIAAQLGVSRSTARAILTRLSEEGIIRWNKRQKIVLRQPTDHDLFPSEETDSCMISSSAASCSAFLPMMPPPACRSTNWS